MNLNEIINRDISLPIDQDEALFVIKHYVKVRKGVDIEPKIFVNQPQMFIVRQLEVMSKLALHAGIWLKNNQYKTQ